MFIVLNYNWKGWWAARMALAGEITFDMQIW